MPVPDYPPVVRSSGATPTERRLQALAEKSFLRLWSYPCVHRKNGPRHKEVADLLVVMGDHVLIFSDKEVAFDENAPLDLAWARWHRGAIMESVKQLKGAERLLFLPQTILSLDAKGTQPFPIAIPNRATARIHRIAVAHGAAGACSKQCGGTGSFFIEPGIKDSALHPFTVGDVDPTGGFIHVLNDVSLQLVLEELDTLPDFVAYLEAKEDLVRSGSLLSAAGEEELLGAYVRHGTPEAHSFPRGKPGFGVVYPPGHWESWVNSEERAARRSADEISYEWDRLVNDFEQHLLDGTSIVRSHSSVAENEVALRNMAATTRTQRRALAERFIEVLSRSIPQGRPWSAGLTQINPVGGRPSPVFVVVAVPNPGVNEEEYRTNRQFLLRAYVMVALLVCADTPGAFGVATEPILPHGATSHDMCYIAREAFGETAQAEARRYQRELHIFSEVHRSAGTLYEFPTEATADVAPPKGTPSRTSGRDRNAPCRCGSGRKQKKCCG